MRLELAGTDTRPSSSQPCDMLSPTMAALQIAEEGHREPAAASHNRSGPGQRRHCRTPSHELALVLLDCAQGVQGTHPAKKASAFTTGDRSKRSRQLSASPQNTAGAAEQAATDLGPIPERASPRPLSVSPPQAYLPIPRPPAAVDAKAPQECLQSGLQLHAAAVSGAQRHTVPPRRPTPHPSPAALSAASPLTLGAANTSAGPPCRIANKAAPPAAMPAQVAATTAAEAAAAAAQMAAAATARCSSGGLVVGGVGGTVGGGGVAPSSGPAGEPDARHWPVELKNPLPPEVALRMLTDGAYQPGRRPQRFKPSQGGFIFKESGERVPVPHGRQSDRWHNSGGKRGARDMELAGRTSQILRRRYGSIASGGVTKWRFHEYCLSDFGPSLPPPQCPDDGADGVVPAARERVEDRRTVLFHVMPRRASKGRPKRTDEVAVERLWSKVAPDLPWKKDSGTATSTQQRSAMGLLLLAQQQQPPVAASPSLQRYLTPVATL
jgi:hypothetical protein